jgi:NADH-quinone oxidoreductase subunit N
MILTQLFAIAPAQVGGAQTDLASYAQFGAILPEILLVLWGGIVLAADLIAGGGIKRRTLGWLAGIGMLFIVAVTWFLRPDEDAGSVLGGMIRADVWTWAFRLLFISGGALTCIASADFKAAKASGEYYALVIFASMAMGMMAASTNIIMLYLATETSSIALYLLAGFMRNSKLSAEAGLKYFVFGAVASTVMLYGLSLMYGMSGATGYREIAAVLGAAELRTPALFSMLLVLVGFAFKMSAVPLHWWAPDVYQGAPTPVSGFISTASKAAGFAIMMRFLFYVFTPGETGSAAMIAWMNLLKPFAVLTLLVGSLGALVQTNVKRMLAYSSVAQAGYVLIGAAAFASAPTLSERTQALAAVLFYLGTYMVTNIGAFTVVGLVSQRMGGDDFKHFAGLGKRAPYLALAMTASILSLLGAPPMVGFAGKFFLFRSAIGVYQSDPANQVFFLGMVIIGVLMVLVSVFYYLAVVKAMFVDKSDDDSRQLYVPAGTSITALICGVGVIATLVFTGPLFEIALSAARAFLSIAPLS